jgi:hypothetical protein
VAAGPPEEIVREKRSYTGAFLKPVLGRRENKKKRIQAAECRRPPPLWRMIPKKPTLGLDPRVDAGFRIRSRSIKMLEHRSLQSEAILL